MPALAPPYAPRRPTETVLYAVVRDHLATFLQWARDTYERPLPRYVEAELRAYLRCGVFAHGFVRCHCDACGHDLLVAFSCKGRGICPSCAGRRMANTAAHLVDRVLPDVPVRQYVLSLPFELRALAAFKASVLGALARIFVASVFARHRAWAKGAGLASPESGAVMCVQRFGGSLNLNVHFHVLVLDGVFTRDADGRVAFSAAPAPTRDELDAIVRRMRDRSVAWLRRHNRLDARPLEERSNETPAPSAIDACAAIAMQRGTVKALPAEATADDDATADHGSGARTSAADHAVEHDGFNLQAGVRIGAGDDLGRERLCRYGLRPPVSLARLQRVPGGRIAYRVKYARRGGGKHRVMTALELLARLAALVPPPRYPLVRYHGVLAPNSSWRKDVVPRPRTTGGHVKPCARGGDARSAASTGAPNTGGRRAPPQRLVRPPASSIAPKAPPSAQPPTATREWSLAPSAAKIALAAGTELLAPNVLSVRHWERLLGGALYAATPRVDWATLLRRTFDVDVLACTRCGGRLGVLGCVTEPELARAILDRLGMSTGTPRVARARDPTDDEVSDGDA